MCDDGDSILEVIHSLPVLSHSVSLAQRTPTAEHGQKTMYMPEYGGCLDTTWSSLKNNALACGIPFNTKPERTRVNFTPSSEEDEGAFNPVRSNDCLVVNSYLDSDTQYDLSVIRILGSTITFDSLSRIPGQCYETVRYGQSFYKSRSPVGIKHVEELNDTLLVNLGGSVEVLKLNCSLNLNCDNSQDEEQRSSHKRIVSVSERTGCCITDACLNPHSKAIIGIASNKYNIQSVKLFDFNSRQPFQSIEWAIQDNNIMTSDSCSLSKQLRGRIIRTFIPVKPSELRTQQLDQIPSHLVNLLVTNEQAINLVDPRRDTLAQTYVNRAKLASFFPVEYLRSTIFSRSNEYQFYSMSNVHLRVFDTRYPGVPVGQVNHMLDSETYNSMNMKLIEHHGLSNLETLCCSSMSRLSFVTFDQTQVGNLINPKSIHLPYHDSSMNEFSSSKDLAALGLSAVSARPNNTDEELFYIFQLRPEGDLLLRVYSRQDDHNEQFTNRIDLITGDDQARPIDYCSRSVPIHDSDELSDRIIYGTRASPYPPECINLLNEDFLNGIEETLDSKRAQEKFTSMKSKLLRF